MKYLEFKRTVSPLLAKFAPGTTTIETKIQQWASGVCDETI